MRKFLTQNEVAGRLGADAPQEGTFFATRAQCLGMGAEPASLEKYRANEFPQGVDITKEEQAIQHFTIRVVTWVSEGKPDGTAFGGEVGIRYLRA